MKKLLAFLLVVLLTASFCACSKEEGETDLDQYKQNEKVITSVTNDQGETFYFDSIDSETVILLSYIGPDTPHALIIPATLNEKSVAAIGEMAFNNCSSISSISFPASVTSIGEYAFACCATLTSLSIPETVTSIGKGAFSACSALTAVTFAENNKITEISDFTFFKCTALTAVNVPGSVKVIGDGAFYGCSALTSATFAEGIQLLGSQLLQSCEKLSSLTLPASVTSIGSFAFSGCPALYRDKITCPAGSKAETYVNAMKLSNTPAEE